MVCCTLCVIFLTSAVGLWMLQAWLASPPPLPDLSDAWWGKGPKEPENNATVWPYSFTFSQAMLNNLLDRLGNTRFTDSLEDAGLEYGFPSEALRKVVKYWHTEYDAKKGERELKKYNHYMTRIEGIDVHFVHVKPKAVYKNRKPLLLAHGWPGSFYEFYKIIPLLTDPKSYGGLEDDLVFEVICPSIPGYGFSEIPHKKGM